MKYSYENVPLNTPVYATAYLIDNETLRAYLKCKPILGEVINRERFEKEVGGKVPRFLKGITFAEQGNHTTQRHWYQEPENIFIPYKSGTKTFRKNGVAVSSRRYADTLDEAIENYNSAVQYRIKLLLSLAEIVKEDFIKEV